MRRSPPGGDFVTPRFWLLVIFLVAVAAAVVYSIPRLEGTEPTIAGLEPVTLGTAPTTLVVEVSDEGSGLRTVELRIVTGDGSKTIGERHFPGSFAAGGETQSERIEIPLDMASLGLADGSATLVVEARDWSWRDGLAGNRAEQSTALSIDTRPPDLEVRSGLTYIYRGGAGTVVYRLGEATPEDGVRVGDAFFPGHPLPADDPDQEDPRARVAIFAIPVDGGAEPDVRVVARDAAGNETTAGFPVRIFDREFSESTINLSRSFLEGTVQPLAEANGLAGRDLGESFVQVNETLRARNEERIRTAIEGGASVQRWAGAFEQMRNSKVTSRFAERRAYQWQARPISKAIHYGFDLASTAGAKVTAANGGVVAFAEDLGIYGLCVLIDHGLGVHSLYAHLSKMDVNAGDSVEKGATLGRSGATGLAGGDHLHFAILVGGYYVDPLEWWDPKWVRSHVEWRLRPPPSKPRG
jgi:murein DD-endopeptidase MepM/ murein hydrolase activator NlpD